MKKIAIIADSLKGGGIEQVAITLSQGFKSKGFEVHIILFKNSYDQSVFKGYKLHILSEDGKVTKLSWLRPYFFSNKMKEIVKVNKFDLVLSNLADFAGMKAVKLAKFDNLYTIIHNTQSKRRFKRHKKKGFSLLKHIKMLRIKKSFDNKKLICVSKGVEDDLLTNISAQPAFVKTIYNPFDFKKINKLSNVVNSDIPVDDYIIHVGRFELGHKRQDVLLKAYKKSNIKHKLVLLGDGQNRKEIESLIIFLDLQEKVLLPGFVSNPYNWIKNAKLFVFASDYEGFGNVLVESLSLKVPVVSTNCASGPCEILKYELSDYLVDTGDIEGLAEKMQSALIHYPEIESKHIEDFEITKIIDQYAQLINP